MKCSVSVVLCCVSLAVAAGAQPYKELTPGFNRIKSRTMIRSVAVPTVANLDFAAYSNNPVRFDPSRFKPKPTGKVNLAGLTYRGYLEGAVNSLAETPLTVTEKNSPMAWKPLENKLWQLTKDDAWTSINSKIAGEKFGDVTVFKPFQEIAAVYLHGEGADTQLWAKIDFMPWVKFLKGITDSDNDGIKEIYGRISLKKIAPENVEKGFAWIRSDYAAKVLNRDEIVDWINVLASYWYPTLNTDMVDMGGDTLWPNQQSVPDAVKKLKGFTVKNPVAVVRGNPFGKPIYNVYLVKGLAAETTVNEGVSTGPIDKKRDTAVSANFKDNDARFAREAKEHGGYEAWVQEKEKSLDALAGVLKGLPESQMVFTGKGDWVFFRKSLEYMTGGELTAQAPDKNPLPYLVEFKKYLNDQNVNMLFVPIPTKSDVYYEKLPCDIAGGNAEIVNPYGRKFLADLQKAGVEVIDVLPRLLAEKSAKGTEDLYQHQDTHWTNRGLQIAAKLIADRIKQYSWYQELQTDTVHYTVTNTTFSRLGDLVDKLPESQRTAFPAVTLAAQQVSTPGGVKYKADRNGPILLIGDSFTGVFELVDCKSAGLGSHIAAKTGLPVDMVTSWGGGPLVRQKMIRARAKYMGPKRVVVYVMVARDLYNYSQSWAPLEKK